MEKLIMELFNIYISGVGGQGIIKTSIVMGEAAMKMKKPVVMSEVHGMAQRGGVVSTEIKIGCSLSPIIQNGHANLLLAFEPLEALRAIHKINKNSYVIINTNPIMPLNISESKYSYPDISIILKELNSKSKKLYTIDAVKIAEKAGNILSLNMVMLGGASAIPGFPLDKDMLLESMKDNLPKKSYTINLKAFQEGFISVSQ
jgi:indolepyruvate ferredoxin oxidoreductase beta subunit